MPKLNNNNYNFEAFFFDNGQLRFFIFGSGFSETLNVENVEKIFDFAEEFFNKKHSKFANL